MRSGGDRGDRKAPGPTPIVFRALLAAGTPLFSGSGSGFLTRPRLIGRLRQSRKRLPSPYVSDIPGHDFVHSAQSLFAQCAVIHGPLDPFSNDSDAALDTPDESPCHGFNGRPTHRREIRALARAGLGLRARQQFSCFSDRVELLECGVHGRVGRAPGPGSIKNGGTESSPRIPGGQGHEDTQRLVGPRRPARRPRLRPERFHCDGNLDR